MQVEAAIEAFRVTRRHYEDECLALMDFASNAYSRFKTASRDEQRAMAKNLLSNSTLTSGTVQVQLHKAFEMVLQFNAEVGQDAPETGILKKWLPAKDSNLD